MNNKPFDFQDATATHVLEAFKNGQRRVLVADEAGLGKTTVASEVVKRVKNELAADVLCDDGLYCIVYVCCNLQIAQQNIDTLSEDGDKVDLSQSRLSMQHFVYYKKRNELKNKGKDTLILSLTPATSFQMTFGSGNADERALMYACLSLLPDFVERKESLSEILVGNAPNAWKWLSIKYDKLVLNSQMENYRSTIISSLTNHLKAETNDGNTVLHELVELCDAEHNNQWHYKCYRFITKLRKIFAEISLEILKPDLVIMDEFQKFSSLIDTSKSTETEENMIARKFFSDPKTYILLLSATPYKPYTTLEELNENNNDEQYKDFHRLMDFLYENKKESADFKAMWHNYSLSLKHFGEDADEHFASNHKTAEDMLYNVMGRTERSNLGIIQEVIPPLDNYLSDSDIMSFIQMQHLIDNCRKLGKKVYSAPVDYTKSSAFQLSFMDNYKLKDSISEAWKDGAKNGILKDYILLDGNAIENYSLKDYRNARLNYVVDAIFGTGKSSTGVETLLWIPASHPYYTQQANVFTRNESLSKCIVFSSWGMVPKMLACMLSYEAERRLFGRTNDKNNYHKEDFQILKDSKTTKALSVLCTVSTYLADLYSPEDCYAMTLSAIKQQIKKNIRAKLHDLNGKIVARVSSLDVYQLLIALDDPKAEIKNIPHNADDVLTEMAIGSPAMCFYRIFKRLGDERAKEHAEDVAEDMIAIFNNRNGVAAVRHNCKSHGNYFQNVIDYCIQGNLQSVLDEFVHMISESKSPDSIASRMKESFASIYPQQVNTIQTFGKDSKMSMRKHFAVDFGSGKQTEKEVTHATNVRSAFNSPFRPFVLASTSVGQEGLDFHWYCRKIIHWNLPSNPQNIEQREGRINRYKCLSVRRNIAKLYHDIISWNEMFEKASSELKFNNSQMVPYWYLPLNDERFKNIAVEKIERIVPMYPMSEDVSRYSRLISVLALYRLTMGQPRQEELLDMLKDKNIGDDETKQLFFDLCPFNRKRNKPQYLNGFDFSP